MANCNESKILIKKFSPTNHSTSNKKKKSFIAAKESILP